MKDVREITGELVDVEPTFGGIYYYVREGDDVVECTIDPNLQFNYILDNGALPIIGETYEFMISFDDEIFRIRESD